MAWKAIVGVLAVLVWSGTASIAEAMPSQATILSYGEPGSDTNIQQLIALLEHEKPHVRAHAATGLAKLGAQAHAPLIARLDRARAREDIAGRESNADNDLIVSDYIFYSLINSWADPGRSLLSWAKSRNSGDVWHFTAAVLGTRGEQSLGYATALIGDDNPSYRSAGESIAIMIGEPAASLLPSFVARIEQEGNTPQALSIVYSLDSFGPSGQLALQEIVESDLDPEIRSAAARMIDPDEQFVQRQIRLLSGQDSTSRNAALSLLSEQPALPASAISPILEARGEAPYWVVLQALAKVEQPTSADARLLSFLTERLDGDLTDAGPGADLSTIALLKLGSEGRSIIVSRVSNQATASEMCRTLKSLERSSAGDQITLTGSARISAARLIARSCGAHRETPMEFQDGPKPNDPRSAIAFITERSGWAGNELEIVCAETSQLLKRDRNWVRAFAALDWGTLSHALYQCDGLASVPLVSSLLARLDREGERATYWQGEEPRGELLGAFELLRGDQRISLSFKDFLISSANSRHGNLQLLAAKLLPSIAGSDPVVSAALGKLMREGRAGIAMEAATAIYHSASEPIAPEERAGSSETGSSVEAAVVAASLAAEQAESQALLAIAEEAIIYHGTAQSVIAYLDEILDRIRAPEFILTSGYFNSLPKFPWPPPRYSSMLTFGQEVRRDLLGRSTDTLGTVQKRLTRTLSRIDPGFESGLFAVPGGFVMLTRLEQINQQGGGLPGNNRWKDVRPPPSSLTDILIRLFAAPPGYYRSIAFVFTSDTNFGRSNVPLPDYSDGGRTLPPAIAKIKYADRNAHAIVYSFRRRDTGKAKMYRELSALQHLNGLGLISALSGR